MATNTRRHQRFADRRAKAERPARAHASPRRASDTEAEDDLFPAAGQQEDEVILSAQPGTGTMAESEDINRFGPMVRSVTLVEQSVGGCVRIVAHQAQTHRLN